MGIWCRGRASAFATVLIAAAGCGGYIWPAVNCEPPPEADRTPLANTATLLLAAEEGVSDALWLQINRRDESGVIGGYLSPEEEHGGGLVLLLTGASTYHPGATREATLDFYRRYGERFRDEGFRVWALALPEDTPYGGAAVDDAMEVMDWLDGDGKSFVGVERVYVVGYSIGAITANILNLKRSATAMVSIGGLTQPNQLQDLSDLYRRITDLFPCNTGMRQMRETLETYGAEGWEALDVVSRVAEIRNPSLFVHIESDLVFFPSNTHALETAYREQLAAGSVTLPTLSFLYFSGGTHLDYVLNTSLSAPVIEYIKTFEPR